MIRPNYCSSRNLQVDSQIMGSTNYLSSAYVIIKRGSTVLSVGDKYIPGETLTVSFSLTGTQFVFQVSNGHFTGATTYTGCGAGTRFTSNYPNLSDRTSVDWVLPGTGSGQVSVIGGHADDYIAVGVTAAFYLTESPPPSSTPTLTPSRSPSFLPTFTPSMMPLISSYPTNNPITASPINQPSLTPSKSPTIVPSLAPSFSPNTKAPLFSLSPVAPVIVGTVDSIAILQSISNVDITLLSSAEGILALQNAISKTIQPYIKPTDVTITSIALGLGGSLKANRRILVLGNALISFTVNVPAGTGYTVLPQFQIAVKFGIFTNLLQNAATASSGLLAATATSAPVAITTAPAVSPPTVKFVPREGPSEETINVAVITGSVFGSILLFGYMYVIYKAGNRAILQEYTKKFAYV